MNLSLDKSVNFTGPVEYEVSTSEDIPGDFALVMTLKSNEIDEQGII